MSCSLPSCSGRWRWSGCWPPVHPPLPGRVGAGRRRRRAVGVIDVEVGGVAAAETALADLLSADLLSADLSGLDLVAMMVDGVHFGEYCCVVALSIDIDGGKHPLALAEGSTKTPPWSPICWSACGNGGWT